MLLEKCNGVEYDPQTHFCYVNECGISPTCPDCTVCHRVETLLKKCGWQEYNPSTHYCFVNECDMHPSCKLELEKDIFSPCPGVCYRTETILELGATYGQVTDLRDNQTYKTVVIGNQTWMASNLNYSGKRCHKCDFPEIGTCKRHSSHRNDITDYCETYGAEYGRLYTWEEATLPVIFCHPPGSKTITQDCPGYRMSICPDGWHLPSKVEWEELIAFAGGEEIAGKKLKAKEGWKFYNEERNGTDDYGFTALAAGKSPESPPYYCHQPDCPPCPPNTDCQCPIVACAPPRPDGQFGESGWWWSSSEVDAEGAYSLNIGATYGDPDNAVMRGYEKRYSMSVRCVKDFLKEEK
jgi:uncharacterized protein (TIGR02145 family)